MALDLVENLLSLVHSSLFSGSLSLAELVFGSILFLRHVLTALNNSIVVLADLLEVLLAHVLTSLLCSSHFLS